MNEIFDDKDLNLGDIFILFGNFLKKQANDEQNTAEYHKRKLYSSKEISQKYPFLKVHLLKELAKNGRVPVTKIGKLNFFEEEDILTYLKNQKIDNYIANNKYV